MSSLLTSGNDLVTIISLRLLVYPSHTSSLLQLLSIQAIESLAMFILL